MSGEIHHPASEADVAALVKEAATSGTPIRIVGGGTRAGLGRPVQMGMTLATTGLSGITLYEPSEMVIGAKAGTPLAEIEAALAEKGQMLAFEPADFRALYGGSLSLARDAGGKPVPTFPHPDLSLARDAGGKPVPTFPHPDLSLARDAGGKPVPTFPHPASGIPTIGAVAAGNISGPRRIWAGAARDSLIGVTFVNGTGEIVKSGGRVMKNVTGLDLVKLQAGAWGTLGVLTEVIFKVVPKPETVATLVLAGLDEAHAVQAMAQALGSPFEITGAAHDPEAQRTLLRIEGFAASVDYRAEALGKRLAAFGPLRRIEPAEGAALWNAIRDCVPLADPDDAAIWRLSLKPSEAPGALTAIRAARAARALYDWGGGLVWLATPATGDAGEAAIRKAAKAANGYATLMRAPAAIRAMVPVFEPEAAPVAALTARIRAAVDPAGLFNPGLMHAGT